MRVRVDFCIFLESSEYSKQESRKLRNFEVGFIWNMDRRMFSKNVFTLRVETNVLKKFQIKLELTKYKNLLSSVRQF